MSGDEISTAKLHLPHCSILAASRINYFQKICNNMAPAGCHVTIPHNNGIMELLNELDTK